MASREFHTYVKLFEQMSLYVFIKSMLTKYRQLFLYGIIGGLSSGIDFVVYSGLIFSGINVLLSNIIGVHTGIITSFTLNSRLNFQMTDHIFSRFVSFYLIGLIGLGVSTLMLWCLVDRLFWNPLIAKILTILVVAIFQFILNKTITFKSKIVS